MNNALLHSDAATQATPGNVLVIQSGEIDPHYQYTDLRMPGGQIIRVATDSLTAASDSAYLGQDEESLAIADGETEPFTIPVVEEKLLVSKRIVPTATVQLHKTVQSYEQTVDELLAVQTFEVEHVSIEKLVESLPSVRQEGETTIYPVVEEQLVLTKQLVLKEEVRITRRASERRDTRVVTLQRDQIDIIRTPLEREPS